MTHNEKEKFSQRPYSATPLQKEKKNGQHIYKLSA